MTETSTRTFGNEDALPRVPLPSVEDSAQRFLEWCSPLLDDEQRAETEKAVRDLLTPDSPVWTLQADLERFAAGAHSWLDEFWPRRYLGRRDRIAVNANFFFQFHPTGADQATRAAELTVAALGHKAQLDDESFPPLAPRGVPQSMEQSKHLFSTTRIPGDPQDSVRTPYTDEWPGPSTERHIVVFSRGRMYTMDVLGPDGSRTRVDEIADGMRTVLAAATERAPVDDLGRLPDHEGPRRLGGHPRVAAGRRTPTRVDLVERALFCVCLDDVTPADEHRGVPPPAGRRQRQPLVRQGRVAGRARRRHVGDQRRALRAGRHDDPHARRRDVRRAGGDPRVADRGPCAGRARGGARGVGARRHAALRDPVRRGGVRRVPGRHRDPADHVRRLRRRRREGVEVLAGRVRADGLPARAPPGEGPDRRDLRVDRDPAVPPRPHRGDARGDAGDRGVRGRDAVAGRVGRREARGVPRRGERTRQARQGMPGRATHRSSTCGSCS